MHLVAALVTALLISSAGLVPAAPAFGAPLPVGPLHLLLRNKPPVPTFSSFTMAEDTVKNGTLTATDPEHKPLVFAKA